MATLDLQHETLVLAKGTASNLKLVHTAVNLLLPVCIVPQSRLVIRHCEILPRGDTSTHSAACPPPSPLASLSASLSLSYGHRRNNTNWHLDRAFEFTFFVQLLAFSSLWSVLEGWGGSGERERESVRKAIKKKALSLPERAVIILIED